MSIKPQPTQDVTADTDRDVLHGGVLQVEGRDAGAFLQAQLMNDVRGLQDGHWQWNGWLTPAGRVVALGALLRLDATRYWLLLPDHPAAVLAQALQRFVFRSKLTLHPCAALALRGAFASPAELGRDARLAQADARGTDVVMDWSGARARCLWIGPRDAIPEPYTASAEHWRMEDLAHGLPRLAPDAQAQHTPQMLALHRLDAFSVKKGCYPGQEIVARTHFLGKAKRELQRLQIADASWPGRELAGQAGSLATVLCAASFEGRHEALAVLPSDPGDGLLTALAPERPARRIAFEDGLRR